MLALDDPRWAALAGGYRTRYDPTPTLRRLAENLLDKAAWKELWQELHHQGDVGDASYASIPVLVGFAQTAPSRDWNLYGLAATIETERHRRTNPRLPEWLVSAYRDAWRKLVRLALYDLEAATDPTVIQTALAVVALGRRSVRLGALLDHLDESEIEELVAERLAWPELYDSERDPPIAG